MFMAPEIVDLNWNSTEYTYSGDIWSIGVIFYCLFSSNMKEINLRSDSNKALIKKSISKLKFQFEEEYIKLIEACLESEPKKRPSSKEILEILISLKNKFIFIDVPEIIEEEEIEEKLFDSKYATAEGEQDLDKSFRF
jgi:serine/threonine protein kinase